MYNIQLSRLVGRTFYVNDKNVVWICIGYGDATDTGRLLIVGGVTESNGETIVRTFRDSDVRFTSGPVTS